MYIFWFSILFINDVTQGGGEGGVSQKMTLDDMGGGGGSRRGQFWVTSFMNSPLRVPLLWSLVNSDLLRVSFIYKLQENGSTTKPTSKN